MARIAQARSSRGLGSLAFAEDLQTVARRHAQRMADQGEPGHNPNLGSEVQDWEIVAENVGVGPDVDAIHEAFMDSTEHRDIILHPDLTQIGLGVVQTPDGRLWVVEVLRKPQPQQQAESSGEPEPEPERPTPAAPTPPPTPAPAGSSTTTPATTPAASPTSAPTTVTTAQSPTLAAQAGPSEVATGQGVAQVFAPVVVTPRVAGVAAELPAQAWVAAFLLAAVVGFQGQALRRLGLVA